MRWDRLFRDLEAQLDAADAAELGAEVADRTRRESALVALVDRVRGAAGSRVSARVAGTGAVEGVLLEAGSQWLLVAEDGGRQTVLPLAAVLSVAGLGVRTSAPGDQVFSRLGLAAALRAIARDRAGVSVGLVDGSVLTGTLDRVGADFVEVSLHGAGEPRRHDEVSGVRTVPFAALASVRSGP